PSRVTEKRAKARGTGARVARSTQLELPVLEAPLDAAYADVTIDDPRAVLSALEAAATPVSVAPPPAVAAPAAPATVVALREGEELVKGSRGGGVVLRRRRVSSEPR
ncbi:MAG TPA: hypothetical protein VGI39_11980, partial [Polyangiaceae bacterium]